VAVHESNNADEVDYLLDVVRSFLRAQHTRQARTLK